LWRNKLHTKFESLRFKVLDFELHGSSNVGGKKVGTAGGQGEGEGQEDQAEEKFQEEQFKERVVSKCAEDAIVFIYMSGIQIPFEVSGCSTTPPNIYNPDDITHHTSIPLH